MAVKNSILVIRLGALGDIIHNFPTMHALRAHYKDSKIVFLTTPPFQSLLEKSPYFDEIWTVGRWSSRQIFKWIAFAKKLKAQNFDHVYDLQRSDRTRIMSYLAPGSLKQKWYGKKASPHIPVFGELAIANIPKPEHIDTSWLTSDITKFRLPPRYAVLVPGCSPTHPYKRWPARHYAKIATDLRAAGITSVLIGTDAEKEVLKDIQRCAPSVLNLCGQTSLFNIAEICRQAQIAIGNDTGPMHIAGIVGCPVISLFSGRTNPAKSKPLGQRVVTLQSQDIAEIHPDSVFTKINQIIL